MGLGRFSKGAQGLLGLDVEYYVRSGSVLFATQAVLITLSFVLSVAFAHFATKELFGQFQFMLALAGTLGVLSLPGVNTVVQLGAAKNIDGTLVQGFRLKRIFALLGALGFGITALYLRSSGHPELWPACIVAMVFFPFIFSLDIVHAFFAGKRKFNWSCGFQLISEGLSVVVAIVLVLVKQELWVILAGYWAMKLMGEVLAYLFAKMHTANREKDPHFTSYSLHLTMMNVIPYAKSFFDKLVVAYFLGFAATAVYSIGQAVSEQLYAVSKNVANVVFPKVAERERSLAFSVVRRKAGLLLVFFGLVASLAVVLSPIVIPFFFSEQYADAIWIAQILVVVSIPRALGTVLTRVQEAQREKARLYAVNIVYSTTEIVGLLILTPFYGLAGLIAAKAVANLVFAGLSFWMIR